MAVGFVCWAGSQHAGCLGAELQSPRDQAAAPGLQPALGGWAGATLDQELSDEALFVLDSE